MNFDELQKEWNEQDSQSQVSVDHVALLKLVQRNQRSFEGVIFRRDSLEIAVALAMVPYWIWSGIKGDLLWTWYLMIPGVLWVAGYLFFDRRSQKRNQPQLGTSLRVSSERAASQVRHQIKLLKNVFWWYLFPIALPIIIYFAHRALLDRDGWVFANQTLFVGLLYWGVYELNQRAVRKNLVPQAEELEGFLNSLEQSSAEEEASESEDDTETT